MQWVTQKMTSPCCSGCTVAWTCPHSTAHSSTDSRWGRRIHLQSVSRSCDTRNSPRARRSHQTPGSWILWEQTGRTLLWFSSFGLSHIPTLWQAERKPGQKLHTWPEFHLFHCCNLQIIICSCSCVSSCLWNGTPDLSAVGFLRKKAKDF